MDGDFMRNIVRFALAGALIAGVPTAALAHDGVHHASVTKASALTPKTAETSAALRDLWVGHVFWVRNVVLAAFAKNDAAANAAEQQVVANAQAIAGAIEPFYGAGAKDALFKLLAGHYGAIKAYLVATASGDNAGQGKATEMLTKNAEEIAVFLSKANPHLRKDDVNGLLLAHGGHHIKEIQELKDGDYVSEAKTWEQMKGHMYVIADALTQALVQQFASKFRS
jgi:hypothetical protein